LVSKESSKVSEIENKLLKDLWYAYPHQI